MEDRLSWLIFGAGAIGTYIGGSLILHGQKVAFYEPSQSAQEIIERGLRLNIHGQEHRILHPDVFTFLPEALSHSTYHLAVFAIKSYDTSSALDQIAPFKETFPPILCLQNGVENEPAIEALLGEERVIAGSVTSAVRRRATGDIYLERLRGIGIAQGNSLAENIATIFSFSGLNARLLPSANDMKWSKMLTNLLANASSAILDMTPTEILGNYNLFAVEIAQLREAMLIMKARQIETVDLPGTPVKPFSWLVRQLPPRVSQVFISRIAGKGRGQKMPSFHIDLHSGRGKSEVDYLNGAVVRAGAHVNISTPVNRWLNETLTQLTQGDLPADEYSHQPEKYLQHINKLIKFKNR